MGNLNQNVNLILCWILLAASKLLFHVFFFGMPVLEVKQVSNGAPTKRESITYDFHIQRRSLLSFKCAHGNLASGSMLCRCGSKPSLGIRPLQQIAPWAAEMVRLFPLARSAPALP